MSMQIIDELSDLIRVFLDRRFSAISKQYWQSIVAPYLEEKICEDKVGYNRNIRSLDDFDPTQLLSLLAKKYKELDLTDEARQYAYNLIKSRNIFAHKTRAPIHSDRYENFKREVNIILDIVNDEINMECKNRVRALLENDHVSTDSAYYTYEDFVKSISRFTGNSENVKLIIQTIYERSRLGNYPFHDLPYECDNRDIKNCVKYKISDKHVLVVVYAAEVCVFCFAGDQYQSRKWLAENEGFTVNIDNTYKRIDFLRMSSDKANKREQERSLSPVFSQGRIIERLSSSFREQLFGIISNSVIRMAIESVESMSSLDYIKEVSSLAKDNEVQCLLYDVLRFLVSGEPSLAEKRLDLYFGNLTLISDLPQNEVPTIRDGKYIKQITDSQWIDQFFENADYQSWMLFMHPEQDDIVQMDFSGPAKLSGVSGSGKTCVIVKRAIRLASEMQEPGQKVLVLTLNDNLAELINRLISYACPQNLMQHIECTSLRKLAIKCLDDFEPQDSKSHKSVTWKTEENIDQIWREFYKLELSNRDAEMLFPIHSSLLARGIFPEDYIKQELDYIRSAFLYEERAEYLTFERIGRSIPMAKNWRELILAALKRWEEKMAFVGIMDDFARIDRLPKYRDALPKFYAVLVDEAQDFSTNELRIVRNLVEIKENDIFLAADMKQRIAHKHQNLRDAGIALHGTRSKTLTENYRNGRAILEAAQKVYEESVALSGSPVNLDTDFETLDPVLSDFMVPKPLILEANSLQEEMCFAYSYAEQALSSNQTTKICIVVVGYTFFELEEFAKENFLNILDSEIVNEKSIFISDMEHVKGYEFDTLIVLNMCHSTFPDTNIPEGERYREYNKLYVVMTRAKKELIISHHQALPKIFTMDILTDFFDRASWDNFLEKNTAIVYDIPQKMPEYVHQSEKTVLQMNGEEFLYTKYAIGFSKSLQDNIKRYIKVKSKKNELSWNTIGDCYNYLCQHYYQRIFKADHDFFMKRIKAIEESGIQ